MNDNARLVIERIERAFAGVRLGKGVSLREADVIDDYGTPAQRKRARALDEQIDWMKIPDELIAKYWWCPCFMDGEGLRFHLPAYMRFALRYYKSGSHSGSQSIDDTISTLGFDRGRFDGFTLSQKAAVRQFLKFMAFNGGRSVDSDNAKYVLEGTWREKNRPTNRLHPNPR